MNLDLAILFLVMLIGCVMPLYGLARAMHIKKEAKRCHMIHATTHRGIYTDKLPSFDTLDEMIAYAVYKGATHMSLSNYHGGAFWKASKPNADKSFCEVMHFGSRYECKIDWRKSILHILHIKRRAYASKWLLREFTLGQAIIGWFCNENFAGGDVLPLETHETVYPWFPVGYTGSEYINKYLDSMRKHHDYTGGLNETEILTAQA